MFKFGLNYKLKKYIVALSILRADRFGGKGKALSQHRRAAIVSAFVIRGSSHES